MQTDQGLNSVIRSKKIKNTTTGGNNNIPIEYLILGEHHTVTAGRFLKKGWTDKVTDESNDVGYSGTKHTFTKEGSGKVAVVRGNNRRNGSWIMMFDAADHHRWEIGG